MARPASTLALLAALLAAPAPLAAHPHVFIDAGVDFLFDPEGRLTHLRITWIYDPLSSLFMLEDLGIAEGGDGSLTEADKVALARYQSQWIEGYDGDSYLYDGDRRVGLSGPIEPQADYRDGAVVIRFLRALEAPLDPGAETHAALYDPTYFTAYLVSEPPRLDGAPADCSAEVVPFEPSGPLVALQRSLAEIPIDGDPETDVGRLFADRVYLRCG